MDLIESVKPAKFFGSCPECAAKFPLARPLEQFPVNLALLNCLSALAVGYGIELSSVGVCNDTPLKRISLAESLVDDEQTTVKNFA